MESHFNYISRNFLAKWSKIMKMFHKSLVAGALLAFAAFGSASADELKFENKVETDTVYIGNLGHDDTPYERTKDYNRFPGITETMKMEYTSEKVDAKAELQFWLFGYNEDEFNLATLEDEKCTFVGLNGFSFGETYIKFRPIEILEIALRAREKAAGSYLPVLDDNVSLGNYTGDFGLLVKPIEGLSIGAGINFLSYIINDYDFYNDPDKIYLNFGAEYELENIGSFALTFNNVINEFGFGAFAKINAINALDIYGGFSYQKESAYLALKHFTPHYYPSTSGMRAWNNYYVEGNIILNAAAEYKGIDKLTLAAELATNCGTVKDNETAFDLYTGLKAEYEINDAFSVSGTSYMSFDFADSRNEDNLNYCLSPLISFYPEVAYKLGNNTFKAGFKMEFWQSYEIDKDTDRKTQFTAAIPLSWTYAF